MTAEKERQQLAEDPSIDRHEWRSETRELITGEVESETLERVMARDRLRAVRQRLNHVLSEHQWMLINLIYLGRLNFRQVGDLLGVCREHIRRCHDVALKKLCSAAKQKGELLNI